MVGWTDGRATKTLTDNDDDEVAAAAADVSDIEKTLSQTKKQQQKFPNEL